ncbi:SNF2 family N-terminal domain-containing protein [Colletotrichum godetiae]|uniref:SNF2 family N-terminal domain-containing protein n=1 Tax=Colletotrichum godetiae TaxID=1209918 RepID=A0AAJ0AQN3_9PEZI|nr:SNF2 family N-terminal domain-containing protein [Colletotrichum godetiae]KAK1688593.1 SNF2 family N-terminal domain-containing protein [Colletotrichum godetiae]
MTFMLERESGWRLDEPDGDVCPGTSKSLGEQRGILADLTGLGKTLSMISLIAHDKLSESGSQFNRQDTNSLGSGETLVEVPLSLLDNWEMELCKHLSGNHFNWRRHHAQNQLRDMCHLSTSDIILTTYTTLAKEWKAHVKANASPVFSHQWHRIILDEAHEIKDLKTAKAQAICELRGDSWWRRDRIRSVEESSKLCYVETFARRDSLTTTTRSPAAPSSQPPGAKGKDSYSNALEKINALGLVCELGCFQKLNLQQTPGKPASSTRLLPRTPDRQSTPLTPGGETEEDDDNQYGAIAEEIDNFCPPLTRLGSNWTQEPSGMLCGAMPTDQWPTKIRTLVDDIKGCIPGTKRLHRALNDAGIYCAKVDGKKKLSKRSRIIDDFSKADVVSVLLLSLGCGAVGLTLTAASRAYLLEPQWNPSIGEHALARIHRIRQTQEVTTVRFVISNSIEQVCDAEFRGGKYVFDIQNGKRDLMSQSPERKACHKSSIDSQTTGKSDKFSLRAIYHLTDFEAIASASKIDDLLDSESHPDCVGRGHSTNQNLVLVYWLLRAQVTA